MTGPAKLITSRSRTIACALGGSIRALCFICKLRELLPRLSKVAPQLVEVGIDDDGDLIPLRHLLYYPWLCDTGTCVVATKPCKDCGKPVSPIADRCVHCERPLFAGRLKDIFSYKMLFLVIVFIVLTQRSMGH